MRARGPDWTLLITHHPFTRGTLMRPHAYLRPQDVTAVVPVPEHPEYGVTCDGRVFSKCAWRHHPSGQWRELKQAPSGSKRRYRKVYLGRHHRWDVHRLVAHVFHGPCPPGQEVRHLDGDSSNNNATNLAYGTRHQNMADARRHGTLCVGEKNAQAILDETRVRIIRKLSDAGASQTLIAKSFEVSVEAISQIVRRKRWGWLE